MRVIDPTGRVPAPAAAGERWRLDMRGQTLGVLWNGKPNADNLFRIIEGRMIARYGMAGTIWVDKLSDAQGPAMPSTEAMFEKLTSGAIAVLTGSGD